MNIESLDSWSSLLRAVLACGILIGVARAMGARLAGNQGSIHLQIVVGINALGLLGLTLGWLPQPIPLGVILAVGGLLSWKAALALFTSIHWRAIKLPRLQTRHAVLGLPLLFTLGPALTFPSGWDELVYHLELPRRWLLAEALTVQADLPYSGLPSLTEIVTWLVAPIEHLVTPRLLTWVLWIHGICLFREALGRMVSMCTADALTFALVASRIALMISANAYVEAFIWADAAALCSLLLCTNRSLAGGSHEAVPRRAWWLAGLLLGGAIATKMTTVGLLAFLPVSWLLMHSKQQRIGGAAFQSAVIAGLFAAPFYLRPWILCGNPFSPYYATWFTTNAATIQTSEYHHALAISNFGIHGWLGIVAGPFALAFAKELYDGTLGWQWLMVLGCAVASVKSAIGNRKEYLSVAALALCVWLYVLWSVTSQQARFGVPFLMLGTLASASAIDQLKGSARRVALICVTALACVSIPWTNFGYYLDSWLCVLKVRSPIDYIRDGVGDSYTELALFLHATIEPDDKVVTLFEHRLAYLPAGVQIATPYFQSLYFDNPAQQSGVEGITSQLKEHGIRYVVLTTTPLGPDVSRTHIEVQQAWFRGIDECLASGALKVIWRSESHAVAELE